VHREALDSSSLRRVGYAPDRRQLEVEFESGALYRYYDVPAEVYAGLLAAESKGRWFNQCFKPMGFAYRRLD
jgi:hypothetical protein